MVLLLAFLAGVLSTLSPCVLPLIPILAASALQGHLFGPLALAAGMAASFALIGATLAFLGAMVGGDGARAMRMVGAGTMAVLGWVLLMPKTGSPLFANSLRRMSVWAHSALTGIRGSGLAAQTATGALLAVVWSPCTGPTLGAAIGMAAHSETFSLSAAILLLFGVGSASPILVLAYIARTASSHLRSQALIWAANARRLFGAGLLTVGVLALTGLDRQIEQALVNLMPYWWIDLSTRL